jgi:hypothetical protein
MSKIWRTGSWVTLPLPLRLCSHELQDRSSVNIDSELQTCNCSCNPPSALCYQRFEFKNDLSSHSRSIPFVGHFRNCGSNQRTPRSQRTNSARRCAITCTTGRRWLEQTAESCAYRREATWGCKRIVGMIGLSKHRGSDAHDSGWVDPESCCMEPCGV